MKNNIKSKEKQEGKMPDFVYKIPTVEKSISWNSALWIYNVVLLNDVTVDITNTFDDCYRMLVKIDDKVLFEFIEDIAALRACIYTGKNDLVWAASYDNDDDANKELSKALDAAFFKGTGRKRVMRTAKELQNEPEFKPISSYVLPILRGRIK
ncbi:MAG: hypothetical protein IKN73_02540 [Alphaproteobacteria bacterium]|nr:hypothetical protein [Alphaproteobacteria bacterium]